MSVVLHKSLGLGRTGGAQCGGSRERCAAFRQKDRGYRFRTAFRCLRIRDLADMVAYEALVHSLPGDAKKGGVAKAAHAKRESQPGTRQNQPNCDKARSFA